MRSDLFLQIAEHFGNRESLLALERELLNDGSSGVLRDAADFCQRWSDLKKAEQRLLAEELGKTVERILFWVQKQGASVAGEFLSEVAVLFDGLAAIDELSILDVALYRAFESLDSLFGFKYVSEAGGVPLDQRIGQERVFAGSGAGVQTPYSTVIRILRRINMSEGAHIVDLGAGYGRVGLLASAWRKDLFFTGFECVGFRVQEARDAAIRVGIDHHVEFICKDLSDKDFQIPSGDVFYLYDPFCAETYERVFAQLRMISKQKRITVVAKGRARSWVLSSLAEDSWSQIDSCDQGSVEIWQSRPT